MAELNFTIRTDAQSVIEGLSKTERQTERTAVQFSGLSQSAQGAYSALSRYSNSVSGSFSQAVAGLAQVNHGMTDLRGLSDQCAQAQNKLAQATERAGRRLREQMTDGSAAQGGGLGNMAALLRSGWARALGVGASVYGAGRAIGSIASQADALENQQLAVLSAASSQQAGQSVIDQLSSFGMSVGANPTDLLAQAARLMSGGVGESEAVQAVQSAVIAARGDLSKLAQILDNFVEMGAKGWVEQGAISAIERQGVDIRTALAESLDMSQSDLQSAIAARQITISQVAQAFARATSEGTAQREAFDAQLNTMSGAMDQLQIAWGDAMETMGAQFTAVLTVAIQELTQFITQNRGLFELLGKSVSQFLEWTAKTSPIFQILGLSGDGGSEGVQAPSDSYYAERQRLAEERRQEQARQEAERAQEAERVAAQAAAEAEQRASEAQAAEQQRLAQQIENNIAHYDQLAEQARRAQQDAELASQTIEQKRLALSERYGVDLSGGVSAVDDQIASEFGERVQQPEALTRSETLRLNDLYAARSAVLALEKQAQQVEQIREQEARRLEIVEAQLDGDTERLELLRQAQQVDELTAKWRQSGMSEEEARALAVDRVSSESALAAQKSQQPAAPQNLTPGWIESQRARVGGSSDRLREIDLTRYQSRNQVPQQTLAATRSVADYARNILSYLNNHNTSNSVVLQ